MCTAMIAIPLAEKMLGALERLKYRVVAKEFPQDCPGMVRITAEPDPSMKGTGRMPKGYTQKELDEAQRFLCEAKSDPERHQHDPPTTAPQASEPHGGGAAAPVVGRIGKVGESRFAAIEQARSLARPVSREIPPPRRLVPASKPQPEPKAARSHNAFRPYPQAEAAGESQHAAKPEAKRTPKGKRTPEQLRAAARKAVETRRLNAARKAAS